MNTISTLNINSIPASQKFKQLNNYFLTLQQDISALVQQEEATRTIIEDSWQSKLGQGQTNILTDGTCFESAGIGFSSVQGQALPAAALNANAEKPSGPFFATGVSVVIHPKNPYVPTTHFNVRYFESTDKDNNTVFWFGGGFDLTPYYGFDEDCRHWHQQAKAACDPFGAHLYPTFKQQCDDYFYLKHRNETRGIGGLFFDAFNTLGFDQSMAFIKNVSKHFMLAYQPIVQKRNLMPYSEKEINFQRYRRGRYVEFNLLYDRGTQFGLQFGGRTESILMSMPPKVNFCYNYYPPKGSAEEKLYTDYLVPKNWV